MFQHKKLSLFLLAITATASFAFADDVTDSIKEALDNYKNQNYTQAAKDLDFASQLIRQKKGDMLKTVLPEPLEGWNALEATSQAVGAALMGGMTSAEKTYTKDSSSVTVRVTSDSPMIQGMVMMMGNPSFASATGSKAIKVNNQDAILTLQSDGSSGDLNFVLEEKFLITVEGSGVTEKDLVDYATAVSIEKLKSL